MPPGFGVLDTALVSVPFLLLLLGLVRGAPVELASSVGCLAGIVAAWMVSMLAPVHLLGPTGGPLVALFAGIVAWRVVRSLSNRFGFDTRWIDLGRLFDSFAGGAMGAVRGVAFVSAGCLSYAMILVPLGLSNPLDTVAYPVFLAVGSRVTSAVIASTATLALRQGDQAWAQSLATVPLPLTAPQIASAQPQPAPSAQPTVPGVALASLMHAIAPAAIAAPMQPVQAPAGIGHDIPVRGIPANLIETHHNIRQPFGATMRHPRH